MSSKPAAGFAYLSRKCNSLLYFSHPKKLVSCFFLSAFFWNGEGGKQFSKDFCCLVWLTTSSCVLSIVISLDLYILLFGKIKPCCWFCSPLYDYFFALMNQELFVKSQDFPLALDVQPPNIYLGACITPEDIQKAHAPPRNITSLLEGESLNLSAID